MKSPLRQSGLPSDQNSTAKAEKGQKAKASLFRRSINNHFISKRKDALYQWHTFRTCFLPRRAKSDSSFWRYRVPAVMPEKVPSPKDRWVLFILPSSWFSAISQCQRRGSFGNLRGCREKRERDIAAVKWKGKFAITLIGKSQLRRKLAMSFTLSKTLTLPLKTYLQVDLNKEGKLRRSQSHVVSVHIHM